MKREYSENEILAMKNIAKMLDECKEAKKKLSRLDYFLCGGISFKEASSAIYNLRETGKITAHEYYTLNEYITFQRQVEVYRTRPAILATKYIFSGKIINDFEKEVVWNQLLNAGLKETDIDDLVFSAAIRAYANRNGYIKVVNNNVSKTKTLKK